MINSIWMDFVGYDVFLDVLQNVFLKYQVMIDYFNFEY